MSETNDTQQAAPPREREKLARTIARPILEAYFKGCRQNDHRWSALDYFTQAVQEGLDYEGASLPTQRPPAPKPSVDELIADCSNALDQLFRQRHTRRDVEVELRLLLKKVADTSLPTADQQTPLRDEPPKLAKALERYWNMLGQVASDGRCGAEAHDALRALIVAVRADTRDEQPKSVDLD